MVADGPNRVGLVEEGIRARLEPEMMGVVLPGRALAHRHHRAAPGGAGRARGHDDRPPFLLHLRLHEVGEIAHHDPAGARSVRNRPPDLGRAARDDRTFQRRQERVRLRGGDAAANQRRLQLGPLVLRGGLFRQEAVAQRAGHRLGGLFGEASLAQPVEASLAVEAGIGMPGNLHQSADGERLALGEAEIRHGLEHAKGVGHPETNAPADGKAMA